MTEASDFGFRFGGRTIRLFPMLLAAPACFVAVFWPTGSVANVVLRGATFAFALLGMAVIVSLRVRISRDGAEETPGQQVSPSQPAVGEHR